MAKLLDAGFDIRKAAAVLQDTRLPRPQAVMLKDLNSGLDAGQTIAAAFGKDLKAITDLERGMIDAGERGGKLAPAFQHLADYFGMLAATRREAVKSMIYPLIVLHLGVFIATVPAAMMKGDQSAGNILLGLVVMLLGFYVGACVIFMVVRSGFRMAPENAGIDRLLNLIPWVGKARRNIAMARFCKVYHACVLAGISMTETVRLATEAAQSGVIREAGRRLVEVAKTGHALGPQFIVCDAFPKTFARSYSIGEEAGTLDKDLARWSRIFQEDAIAAAKSLAVMVPKVLYFFILGFVAWQVVGFFNDFYTGMFKQLDE